MFEQECIQFLLQLQSNGIIITGDLVGVNETTQISKAIVSVLQDGDVNEKYIIIYKENNSLVWKYLKLVDNSINFDPDDNGWLYPNYLKRIIAPVQLIMDDIGIKMYGWFLINELPVHKLENFVHMYCNVILTEHQYVIDNLQGVVTIENRP